MHTTVRYHTIKTPWDFMWNKEALFCRVMDDWNKIQSVPEESRYI